MLDVMVDAARKRSQSSSIGRPRRARPAQCAQRQALGLRPGACHVGQGLQREGLSLWEALDTLGAANTPDRDAAAELLEEQVIGKGAQLSGKPVALLETWTFWVLLDLVPVLAMAAFHRDAPPPARRPWLLALPATYLLIYVPLLALQATGKSAWVPDFPGLFCILVSLACLARAPGAWSRRSASSGVWSLTLALLAAVAGALRIVSIANYLQHLHLNTVSLAELVILLVAVALVAPDAVRAQAASPAPPPDPHTMAD